MQNMNDVEAYIVRGETEFTFKSTQNGNLLVPYDEIVEARQEVNEKASEDVFIKSLAVFIKKLAQIAPVFPTLEPLEFVK